MSVRFQQHIDDGYINNFLVQHIYKEATPLFVLHLDKYTWSDFRTSPNISFLALLKTSASVEAGVLEKETIPMHLLLSPAPSLSPSFFSLKSAHEEPSQCALALVVIQMPHSLGNASCQNAPPLTPHIVPGGGR